MITIFKLVCWILVLCAALWAISTTTQLIQFISSQQIPRNESMHGVGAVGLAFIGSCTGGAFFFPLLWNFLYVAVFVIQHILMASSWWKGCLAEFGISPLERCVYVLATCASLDFFMNHSAPLDGPAIWSIDTSERFLLWLFFFLVHALLWFIILASAYFLDISELIGWVNVHRYFSNEPSADDKRSPECQRLFDHSRHGGAGCFLLLLWIHPVMTIERLLFSLILSLFILLGQRVDREDALFVKQQARRGWEKMFVK